MTGLSVINTFQDLAGEGLGRDIHIAHPHTATIVSDKPTDAFHFYTERTGTT
jgi:hypothetical protein